MAIDTSRGGTINAEKPKDVMLPGISRVTIAADDVRRRVVLDISKGGRAVAWIITNDDDKAILQEIEAQTDRASALIAVAYLEQRLIAAIKSRTNRDEGLESRLYKGSGALAAFSTKIDLAYLLGVIDQSARRTFHQIRDIRNNFAHDSKPISFGSPSIKDRCKNFCFSVQFSMRNNTNGQEVEFTLEESDDARTCFLNAVKYLLFLCDMELQQQPPRIPAPPVIQVGEYVDVPVIIDTQE